MTRWKNSINERLRRGAIGDSVSDLAGRRLIRTRLRIAGQGGTSAEAAHRPFEVRRIDDSLGVVVVLSGDLDLVAASLLQRQLDRAMRAAGAVVIDLSGLRFIDSSGLNVLVAAERRTRAVGGQLLLVYGPGAVQRVFEVAGLDRYFAWSDSTSAALRAAWERCGAGAESELRGARRS